MYTQTTTSFAVDIRQLRNWPKSLVPKTAIVSETTNCLSGLTK
jgi:hypothetical protein